MTTMTPLQIKLGKNLILDELFDLTLYNAFYQRSTGSLRSMLEELIRIEEGHYQFWQNFFQIKIETLDFQRRVKFFVVFGICKIFGEYAIHLTLEAIEIHGIRQYVTIWDTYRGTDLGEAVKGILQDELKHEDEIVSALSERKISPERIRSIFLGFNDGLVELLGAVSGFFAVFGDLVTVFIAGLTVAVAGSISMAAGVFVSSSSAKEVEIVARAKSRVLNAGDDTDTRDESSLFSSILVGLSYFIGALIPMAPIFLGSRSIVFSILFSAGTIILVSLVLSFLSGMEIKKRIFWNFVIITSAVIITYTIASAVKNIWGVSV